MQFVYHFLPGRFATIVTLDPIIKYTLWFNWSKGTLGHPPKMSGINAVDILVSRRGKKSSQTAVKERLRKVTMLSIVPVFLINR